MKEKETIQLYKEGDTVSHSYHGIGTIKSIGEKEILGSKAVFVTMYFDRESLKLTVGRSNLEEQIREVLSENEAEKVLNYLAECDKKLSRHWKTRNRRNQERLTSGDPYEVCDVAKGLLRLKHRRKGDLSNSDRMQLNRALELLAEELSMVLDDASYEDMLEEVRETCETNLAA